MSEFKKNKFSFKEVTMNSDGKQSGSGFVGVIMGLIAVLAFVAGIVGWYLGLDQVMELLEKVLKLGGLSALLMGVRKAAGIFGNGNGKVVEAAPKPIEPKAELADLQVNPKEERG